LGTTEYSEYTGRVINNRHSSIVNQLPNLRSADILSAVGWATFCRPFGIQRTECPPSGSFQNESAPLKMSSFEGPDWCSLVSQLSTLNSQLSTLDSRLSTLDSRLSTLDSRLSTLDSRLSTSAGRNHGILGIHGKGKSWEWKNHESHGSNEWERVSVGG
jgi:hypothetical protein